MFFLLMLYCQFLHIRLIKLSTLKKKDEKKKKQGLRWWELLVASVEYVPCLGPDALERGWTGE